MRLSSLALIVAIVLVASVGTPSAGAQEPSSMAAVHERLLADGIAELERQIGLLEEAWARVDAGAAAVLTAQQQGENLDNLRLREDRLQQLESQLLMRLLEVQRARRDVLTHRAVIDAAGGEAAARTGPAGVLSGSWDLTVQPGLTGTAFLVQQGTLVTGTYELSGGWTGSLRGTLVSNKVRLERIDSKLGFAAIFYGELDTSGEQPVIQGRWEATQLATGMPSAGGWRAVQQD